MMTINSTTKTDRVAATLVAGRARSAAVISGAHGQRTDWALMRPLSSLARSVRVWMNEAIDASRGRYDR